MGWFDFSIRLQPRRTSGCTATACAHRVHTTARLHMRPCGEEEEEPAATAEKGKERVREVDVEEEKEVEKGEKAEKAEEAAEEEKRCRLCLEGEEDGPLVQPCACRGSIKWVHGHCLEKVRRTSPKRDAAYRCGQCRDRYRDALS